MNAEIWNGVLDALGGVFLVLGTWLTFVAALGLQRLPNILARMHAATKPQTLGLALVMVGLGLSLRSPIVSLSLVLVVAFQMITAPISAQMVSRAAYRTGAVRPGELFADEILEDMRSAEVALEIEKHGRSTAHETRLDAEG